MGLVAWKEFPILEVGSRRGREGREAEYIDFVHQQGACKERDTRNSWKFTVQAWRRALAQQLKIGDENRSGKGQVNGEKKEVEAQ